MLTRQQSMPARLHVHHSRDTQEKQWNETRVLVLQATQRIVVKLLNGHDRLKENEDGGQCISCRSAEWWPELWSTLLDAAVKAVLDGTRKREVRQTTTFISMNTTSPHTSYHRVDFWRKLTTLCVPLFCRLLWQV